MDSVITIAIVQIRIKGTWRIRELKNKHYCSISSEWKKKIHTLKTTCKRDFRRSKIKRPNRLKSKVEWISVNKWCWMQCIWMGIIDKNNKRSHGNAYCQCSNTGGLTLTKSQSSGFGKIYCHCVVYERADSIWSYKHTHTYEMKKKTMNVSSWNWKSVEKVGIKWTPRFHIE